MSCGGGHHHDCSCHSHHHCACQERHHECSCHAERETSPHHGRRHGFLSREEYVEWLDEEREILERRLRHLKAELEELRAEGRGTE